MQNKVILSVNSKIPIDDCCILMSLGEGIEISLQHPFAVRSFLVSDFHLETKGFPTATYMKM